ncbi:peroxidasin homolog [Trichogramma pretiosum]|uniref:peroxidasin homolog n=1 Tax=Trichogramma pretiosum TaxID=7493 RepID=UPI0006C94C76|nr:peroxidasin homolog [Trichogramma pretiosum]
MKQLLVLLLATVLVSVLAQRAEAACQEVENRDLIEWRCEGGAIDDLLQVPNNVEKLRVSQMNVGRLDGSLLSRFSNNLLVLSCSHCGIGEIDDRTFRDLGNLQQLSLDNNKLREVRAAWFQGLVYLTFLDLNYNEIERLDGNVLAELPGLVDLRLSGNKLQCLDLQAMSSLRSLQRVYVNENPDFGCPNALRDFLREREIDFEPDPSWEHQPIDRIFVARPYTGGHSFPPPSPTPMIPTTHGPVVSFSDFTEPPRTLPPRPAPTNPPPPSWGPSTPGNYEIKPTMYDPLNVTTTMKVMIAGHQQQQQQQKLTTEPPNKSSSYRSLPSWTLTLVIPSLLCLLSDRRR